MVAGVQILALLSSVLMAKSPKSINCDAGVLMGSSVRFILQLVQISWLEPSDIFSPSTSLKIGGATRLLVNCQLMEVSNLLDFLRSGKVDFCISPIYWIALRP